MLRDVVEFLQDVLDFSIPKSGGAKEVIFEGPTSMDAPASSRSCCDEVRQLPGVETFFGGKKKIEDTVLTVRRLEGSSMPVPLRAPRDMLEGPRGTSRNSTRSQRPRRNYVLRR